MERSYRAMVDRTAPDIGRRWYKLVRVAGPLAPVTRWPSVSASGAREIVAHSLQYQGASSWHCKNRHRTARRLHACYSTDPIAPIGQQWPASRRVLVSPTVLLRQDPRRAQAFDHSRSLRLGGGCRVGSSRSESPYQENPKGSGTQCGLDRAGGTHPNSVSSLAPTHGDGSENRHLHHRWH